MAARIRTARSEAARMPEFDYGAQLKLLLALRAMSRYSRYLQVQLGLQ